MTLKDFIVLAIEDCWSKMTLMVLAFAVPALYLRHVKKKYGAPRPE